MFRFIILFSIAILFTVNSVSAQNVKEGMKLFRVKCASCHYGGTDAKVVGPDLKGINSKRKESWLIPYIKSSQDMIKAGDKTAMELYIANKKVVMPDQNLSSEEIRDILAYIKTWGE